MDELLDELNGMLENHQNDDDTEMVATLTKTIALLKNNPKQAEWIWETFMNLLDCASRDDANHFFGFTIRRF
tara:strand:+ start:856 stop:1071 length:216 start_codon:yes stop_codon:yes gene_type:complete